MTRRPDILPCLTCGKPLLQSQGHRARLYCDEKCRRPAAKRTGAAEIPTPEQIAERAAEVRARWGWYVERERQEGETGE